MSEFEEKLEGILGNPQAMAQIMSLAQSLNLGGGPAQSAGGEAQQTAPQSTDGPESSAPPPAAEPNPPIAAGSSQGGLGGLLGGLSSLDPKMLSTAASLIGQFNSGNDDQRTALLTALRPFVKEQRYAKLDKAIQIAKLSRLIRSGLDLLRSRREEDGHV